MCVRCMSTRAPVYVSCCANLSLLFVARRLECIDLGRAFFRSRTLDQWMPFSLVRINTHQCAVLGRLRRPLLLASADLYGLINIHCCQYPW